MHKEVLWSQVEFFAPIVLFGVIIQVGIILFIEWMRKDEAEKNAPEEQSLIPAWGASAAIITGTAGVVGCVL